jgi:hypothetical protein
MLFLATPIAVVITPKDRAKVLMAFIVDAVTDHPRSRWRCPAAPMPPR